MAVAFLWGLFAASSLVMGAALALKVRIPRRILGLIMAFGVGVLISAVSFELIEGAFQTYGQIASAWHIAVGLLAGALTFFIGDSLISRMGRQDDDEQ